jgi:hypothetical protein
MNIGELEVFFGSQVKEKAESKVAKCHQVAHWFHNIPT